MLCYRCGSHVPDTAESCANCGQKLSSGGVRQATGTFSRRKLGVQTLEGAPFQPGDVVSGRYTIRDALGQGPLGFVFRAHDKEADADVALKVVNPRLVQSAEERRQFQKVLRLARKLSHQNLLRVYEEGEDAERPYFTMQLLEGLTLRKIIDLRVSKGQLFTVKEVEPIFAQMAQALESAHKLGPHADFKPENVIVLPDLLKVSDYGLGLALPRPPFVQAMKQRKADRYIAPEYVQGLDVDARMDIYSLGAIVAEMLSGLVPGDAQSEQGPRNPDIPQAMEALYRRALNPNPLARPKSALEFFEEFQDLARRALPPPLRPRPEPAAAASPHRRLSGSTALQAPGRPRTPDRDQPSAGPATSAEEDVLSEELEVTPSIESQTPTPSIRGKGVGEGGTPPARPRTDDDDTALMPSIPPPLLGGRLDSRDVVSYQTGPTPSETRFPTLLLVILILSGLALGAAGGFWLLRRLEKRPVVQAVPTSPNAPLSPRPATPDPETLPSSAASGERRLDPHRAASVREAETLRQAEEQRRLQQLRAELEARKARALDAGTAAPGPATAAEATPPPAPPVPTQTPPPQTELAKATVPPIEPGAACTEGMRHVPGGAFRMGTTRDDPMMGFDEKVLSNVEVGSFCIDQFEFPNRRGAMPAVNVTYADARRQCESRGKRLCTEEEWEKACKGPGNVRFPYGNAFDANACNTEDEAGEDRPVAASGRFSKCRSGYGVADLSGNVAEWTSSYYVGNTDRVQKGGSSSRPDFASRCSARKNGTPSSKAAEVGFRCCMDAANGG